MDQPLIQWNFTINGQIRRTSISVERKVNPIGYTMDIDILRSLRSLLYCIQ